MSRKVLLASCDTHMDYFLGFLSYQKFLEAISSI